MSFRPDVNSQFCGQLHDLGGDFQAAGEHHHMEFFRLNRPIFRHIANVDVAGLVIGIHAVNPGADKAHPAFLFGPPVILLKILPMGAHVHEEDGGVQGVFLAVLLGDDRLLDGVHAAHRRAVRIGFFIPGAHTLQPGDLGGFIPVVGAHDMALERPRGAQDALEFHAVDDIGGFTVFITGQRGGDRRGRSPGPRPRRPPPTRAPSPHPRS